MAKQSKQQWYQHNGIRSILAIVTVAVVSIVGALYMQSSNAAVAPFSGENISKYKIISSVDYTGMKPFAGAGLAMPFTVTETLNPTVGAGHPNLYGKTVYAIHATRRPGVNSHLAWVTTEGKSTFHVNPSVRTVYKICALVRRDKSAPAESVAIVMPGRNLKAYDLSGSQYYRYLCTDSFLAEPNIVPGYDINGRVHNANAPHALRVASILLVQVAP